MRLAKVARDELRTESNVPSRNGMSAPDAARKLEAGRCACFPSSWATWTISLSMSSPMAPMARVSRPPLQPTMRVFPEISSSIGAFW